MIGPLDPQELTDAGFPEGSFRTLQGRFPITYGVSSLPPGSLDRMATDYFELFCATRPTMVYETSGARKRTAFHYKLGDVTFSTPNARWRAQWSSRLAGISLHIQPAILESIARDVFNEPEIELSWRHVWADHVPAIAYLALDIESQASAGYPAGVSFVERQVETLLAMLARRYSSTPKRNTSFIGIHSSAVIRALDYINHNLRRPLSIEVISDAAGASASHLNKLFRAEVSVSVWAYVQSRRFEEIKKTISTTSMAPDKVAKRYGYASIDSVNKLYQRKTGRVLVHK